MGLEKPVLNIVEEGGNKVKHIQRGFIDDNTDGATYNVGLSGFTNLEKMSVRLDGYMGHSNGIFSPAVYNLTLDTLTLYSYTSNTHLYVSYEVIEFE